MILKIGSQPGRRASAMRSSRMATPSGVAMLILQRTNLQTSFEFLQGFFLAVGWTQNDRRVSPPPQRWGSGRTCPPHPRP